MTALALQGLCCQSLVKGFEQIKPFVADTLRKRADFVLGTVREDFDVIGKDLFRIMLEIKGIKVLDLGVVE